MEIFLSAVIGELASRTINFIISKSSKPEVLDVEESLQRAILRAQVIIDEGTRRHITNQAMLQQLDMLRDAMYNGCYTLDTLRYQSNDEEDTKDQVVSHPLSLSKVNSLKWICSSNRKAQILEQLQVALDTLNSMILEMKELVVFLTSYPRLYQQPYSMHLLLGNCMFGRQLEAEIVLNFLLCTEPSDTEELEVLPVVGPGRVGKSTLVAHVCKDERVRGNFSEIVFFSNYDFIDEKVVTTLRDGCVKKYQNSTSNKYGRTLVVVEVAGDFKEDGWKRLYAASKRCFNSGSKIIVTSRSDKIARLGTRKTVTLEYLSDEAYWYFFKTLAVFGSTDPMMHQRMAYLAMEISRTLKRSPISAMSTAFFLRDNFDANFWCKLLTFVRGFIKWHVFKFGEHPADALNQNKPVHLGRMFRTAEEIVVYDQYECSSQEEVPMIELPSLVYGSIRPSGRFNALALRSPIPPYYNYIYTCEIRDVKTASAKRKRS